MRISLKQAIKRLLSGGVVALPTETVYGLAASMHNEMAISEIFRLKGRPSSNPLIIHLAAPQDVLSYVTKLPKGVEELMENFWPGALTLVMEAKEEKIFPCVRAGLATAAFRVPKNPLTGEILQATGPLVMPSANLSGRPSATKAAHVEEDFGLRFPVVEADAMVEAGLESTILVDQSGKWGVGRLGAIAAECFTSILGYTPSLVSSEKTVLCPGMLLRHYSPKARIIFDRERLMPGCAPGCAIVGFWERAYPPEYPFFALGSLSDPMTVGKRLYAVLRELDQQGIEVAWVDVDFPQEGLWKTIQERLKRASMKEEGDENTDKVFPSHR